MSAAWQVYSGGRCSFDHDPCGSAGTIASPFSPYNAAHYSSDQLPSSSSTRIPLPQPNDSHEMRTFRIQGPFGLNISLATSVPGTLRVTFPNRAQSEPPVNVAASPVAPLSRSHSDYSFSIPYEYPMIQDVSRLFAEPSFHSVLMYCYRILQSSSGLETTSPGLLLLPSPKLYLKIRLTRKCS